MRIISHLPSGSSQNVDEWQSDALTVTNSVEFPKLILVLRQVAVKINYPSVISLDEKDGQDCFSGTKRWTQCNLTVGLRGHRRCYMLTLVFPMYVILVVFGLFFAQDMQMLEGSLCEHWVQDDGISRIHIFIDSVTQGERQ